MVIETPLLKVSRPVAACSRCRSAKIKCDGKLPACSACEKTGKSAECANANDSFAKGKERSYVSTLETRIEKLERRLRDVQTRKASTVSAIVDDPTLPHSVAASIEEAPNARDKKLEKAASKQEARDIDELVADFGYLTVNATVRDYTGFTNYMSFARLILSACAKNELPHGMRVALPPRHIAVSSIQYYMDNIFVFYPFFDQSGIFYSLDVVYKADASPASYATPFDFWSVRMVLAIASASRFAQRGDQHYMQGVAHLSAALTHAEAVLKPGAITTVQSLLFLSLYAQLDPHHFDFWGLVGAASRAMIDLGLHQDPSKPNSMPKARLQLRRHIYYCVYNLDRSVAIVQKKAFSFSEDSAEVASPFGSKLRTSPSSAAWSSSLAAAHILITLRTLQAKWYHDLFQSGRDPWSDPYPYIWKACHDMAQWFKDVPSRLPEPVRVVFELELLFSYITILGPSSRVPKPAPYAQTLLFEHCVSYAKLMSRSLADLEITKHFTFDDNLRAHKIGLQLSDVLAKSRDQLISGVVPEPPRIPDGSTAAPTIPPLQNDTYVNVVRAMSAIKSFQTILRAFGTRWGLVAWYNDFEAEVEQVIHPLNSRLWELQQGPEFRRPAPHGLLHRNSSGSSAAQDSLYAGESRATSSQYTESQLRALRMTQAPGYAPSPFSSTSDNRNSTSSNPATSPPYSPPYPPANAAPISSVSPEQRQAALNDPNSDSSPANLRRSATAGSNSIYADSSSPAYDPTAPLIPSPLSLSNLPPPFPEGPGPSVPQQYLSGEDGRLYQEQQEQQQQYQQYQQQQQQQYQQHRPQYQGQSTDWNKYSGGGGT